MPIDAQSDHSTTTASPSVPPIAGDQATNNSSSPIARAQRALLEDLLALHSMQAEALDRGDLGGFAQLSELRGTLVSEAAPHLPPHTPWDPELGALVAQAQERAGELQQAVHACMAVIRRDLITPAGRRPAAHSPREQQPD